MFIEMELYRAFFSNVLCSFTCMAMFPFSSLLSFFFFVFSYKFLYWTHQSVKFLMSFLEGLLLVLIIESVGFVVIYFINFQFYFIFFIHFLPLCYSIFNFYGLNSQLLYIISYFVTRKFYSI